MFTVKQTAGGVLLNVTVLPYTVGVPAMLVIFLCCRCQMIDRKQIICNSDTLK